MVDGTWGFASHVDLTPEAAERMAEQAVAIAKVSRPLSTQRVELADEPSHADVTWVSPYETDPFSVPDAEQVSLLADWSAGLLAHDVVAHTDAAVHSVVEQKFYADLAGTTTTQQRVRINCEVEAVGIDKERPVRDDAHPRAAGRPRVGVPHRHRARLGRPSSTSCPSTWPRSCGRRRSRPATTTSSSTRATCG